MKCLLCYGWFYSAVASVHNGVQIMYCTLVSFAMRLLQQCGPKRSHGALLCRWFYQKAVDSFGSWEATQIWLHSHIPSLWSCIMLALIGHFFKDCIEKFAQSQASYEHDLELRAKALSLKCNQ